MLDLQLPDLSGLDLQRQMADAHHDIPIVFISGYGDISTSVKAMKAGAIEFLTKPLVDDGCPRIGSAGDCTGFAPPGNSKRRLMG